MQIRCGLGKQFSGLSLLVLLLASASSLAQTNGWTNITHGSADYPFYAEGSLLLLANGNQVSRSTDAGTTWEPQAYSIPGFTKVETAASVNGAPWLLKEARSVAQRMVGAPGKRLRRQLQRRGSGAWEYRGRLWQSIGDNDGVRRLVAIAYAARGNKSHDQRPRRH